MLARGGSRQPGRGCLPAVGDSRSNVLRVVEKYGQLGVTELRSTCMVEEENARSKRLMADLTLDRQILQEVLRKKV